jgi:hypothetical protein
MARDAKLEARVECALRDEPGKTQKAMFGGVAWLIAGHLLCAAREEGMLARVGPERNAWALAKPGVAPMVMRGKALDGWVRAAPGASEATRKTLIAAALAFVRAMPDKPKPKRPPRRAGEAIGARGGARR